MAPQVTDYTKLTKFEQYYAFAAVSSLFFIWGLSYGLVSTSILSNLTIRGSDSLLMHAARCAQFAL